MFRRGALVAGEAFRIGMRETMRLTVRYVALVMVMPLLGGGCASTASFSALPIDEAEFQAPLTELKKDYADIEKYDRMFSAPSDAPRASELAALWGEPKVEKRWGEYIFVNGLGIGLAAGGYLTYPLVAGLILLFPLPQEDHIWNKGDYEIVARVRTDAYVRYEERMHSWSWRNEE